MRIFFHAKTTGFFPEVIHGARTVTVPDPDWERPSIQFPDPDWVPSEEFSDESTPLFSTPDLAAEPPLIEQQNPACSLPPAAELVEVSESLYTDLLSAQSGGQQMITADKDGRPVLKPNPGPSVEDLQRQERLVRDRALLSTDPLVARHRDELETGRSTTITVSQYQQLQGYRQDLRDWPESKGFPSIENRPVVPEWLIPILEE